MSKTEQAVFAKGLDVTPLPGLPKAPTGIGGLDVITGGGLPKGRPTLVCGPAGCGKTLLAMEFLVRGARDFGEPGVFLAFEESHHDLTANVASLGFDVAAMEQERLLVIDQIELPREDVEETGEFNLEGLFVRLGYLIDTVGAKRVALDSLEVLFGIFADAATVRSELRRLFEWLKDRGVTAVITAERGESSLTRHGIEEYVSDCVLTLDHRVNEQISTRRLRVLKYRGSTHGTNEYPFVISDRGIQVMPLTSARLDYGVSNERVSTGVARLDTMLAGGLYRGGSVLVSGTAGTGKTSLAATVVDAACRRGERALYFSFEESETQIVRNARSVGLDLEQWVRKGLLGFHCSRPTLVGLEAHLVEMYRIVQHVGPGTVVVDPITSLLQNGLQADVRSIVTRMIDLFKSTGTTVVLTSIAHGDELEQTKEEVSSLVDTWLLVRVVEDNGERNRALYVLKSRGTAHSNQVREFVLSDCGIELVDVYIAAGRVLTGSARLLKESGDRRAATLRAENLEQTRVRLERRRQTMGAQIAALQEELQAAEDEVTRLESVERFRDEREVEQALLRSGDAVGGKPGAGRRAKAVS
jgi:circadian clock protein KaiC